MTRQEAVESAERVYRLMTNWPHDPERGDRASKAMQDLLGAPRNHVTLLANAIAPETINYTRGS
jgi:hypothetical protein